MTGEPWRLFGSGVVEAEALVRRAVSGPPRDLAGLVIEDAEVDRLLGELPGIGEPDEAVRRSRPEIESLLARVRSRFHDSLGDRSRFSQLVRSARLRPGEAEVFAVLAAVELSPGVQRLLAYAQDDVSATRPWLATLDRLFPPGHQAARAVAEDAALRVAELVRIDAEGPWATRSVSLAPRVAWALEGDDSADPALPPGWEALSASPRRPADPAPDLLLVHGADRATRREAAARTGRPLIATALPADDAGWRALVREATVSDVAVLLEVRDALLAPEAAHWIDRAAHVAWVIASPRPLDVRTLPRRPWREQALPKQLASAERWEEAFGRMPERGHRLDPESVRLARIASDGIRGDLDAAVRRLAAGQLDDLAVRIESRRTWDDLVLPPKQRGQLRELAARYRHSQTVYERWGFRAVPSAGLVALFAGPSGTGKTLAAEVIGADLGLDVYRIDLSQLVSKYVGETEKNLSRIFEAAEEGSAILFFDEADALFGKRSEVSDAHDRYANVEVAYLLQRIEAYDGMVVLATNLRANMDEAFLRRIHVSVEFREPDQDERRRIWGLAFPDVAPTAELDLDWLARQFRLTGGHIRNAAVTAAFLAADAGHEITMEDVVRGIDRELEKLGRLRTQADFDRYYYVVTGEEPAP